MKLRKNIILLIISLIILFTNSIDCQASGVKEYYNTKNNRGIIVTYDRVDYTESIGFDFFDVLPPPNAKSNGRGEPLEKLVSDYGDSYINNPYLRNEMINFRRWQWKEMYTSLNNKSLSNPHYLDTYRLQAEAYLINKQYNNALSQLDQILRRKPTDIQALSLSILAQKCRKDKDQINERLEALSFICPKAHTELLKVLKFCDENNANNINYGAYPLTSMKPDVIAVFGQSPNSDGTPSPALLTRLEKTKEMAIKFPDIPIVLSGGPVKTKYSEASVMYNWLRDNGIDESRLLMDEQARDTPGNAIGMLEEFKKLNAHNILVIGTIMHLPRASTVLQLYGDSVGYELTIDCAGGGNQPTKKQKESERLYTYVNALRAAGLFTKHDFEDYYYFIYN